jgi:hypothetical protein
MSTNVISFLDSVGDFVNWQYRFARIEGFLHDLEGYTLMQLAARGGGVAAIVETGSFMGRSTAFLAAGSKLAGREKVVAVDHFRGSQTTIRSIEVHASMCEGSRKVAVQEFTNRNQPACVGIGVQCQARLRLRKSPLNMILVKKTQAGAPAPREFFCHLAQQAQVGFAATTGVRPGLLGPAIRTA